MPTAHVCLSECAAARFITRKEALGGQSGTQGYGSVHQLLAACTSMRTQFWLTSTHYRELGTAARACNSRPGKAEIRGPLGLIGHQPSQNQQTPVRDFVSQNKGQSD